MPTSSCVKTSVFQVLEEAAEVVSKAHDIETGQRKPSLEDDEKDDAG